MYVKCEASYRVDVGFCDFALGAGVRHSREGGRVAIHLHPRGAVARVERGERGRNEPKGLLEGTSRTDLSKGLLEGSFQT